MRKVMVQNLTRKLIELLSSTYNLLIKKIQSWGVGYFFLCSSKSVNFFVTPTKNGFMQGQPYLQEDTVQSSLFNEADKMLSLSVTFPPKPISHIPKPFFNGVKFSQPNPICLPLVKTHTSSQPSVIMMPKQAEELKEI